MIALIVAIGGLVVLLAGAAIYVRAARRGATPIDARLSAGLAIGLLVAAAIAIPLSELGGYHEAMSFAIPAGLVLGSIFGLLLQWRHRHNSHTIS